FAVYFLSYASQALLFGPAIRSMLRERGESLPAWNLRRVCYGLVAVPTAQLTHLVALFRAQAMRTVVWRGVHYRIGVNPRLKVVRDDTSTPPVAEPLARSA
ncbi:MAG: hypothetical protein KDA75_07460, partial [Planctomycetaceae bacterium]|nr:hypothetical protein [Planctomycetaceae bacterium]